MNTGLHQMIDELNDEQAALVADFVASLLADDGDQALDDQGSNEGTNGDGETAGGWIEVKMINGFGPYAYLRWWQGKRKRSKYLGKVKDLGGITAG